MKVAYKIKPYNDNEYEIYDDELNQLFVGSLADCYAWIKLTELGLLEEENVRF